MNKPLTDFNRGLIVGLKLANCSNKAVLEYLSQNKLEGSSSTIKRVWKQWQESNKTSTNFKGNSGRKPKLTEESKDKIESFILQNPSASRRMIESNENANPQGVSGQTLLANLKSNGFYQKSDRTSIIISDVNKEKRVLWAKKLLRGQRKDLQSCIYTDETWIYFQNDYKSKTWMHEDKQPKQSVRFQDRWPQKCLVWGAIHQDGAVALKFIDGNINAHKYLTILEEFFSNDLDGFQYSCFQQDNAKSHTSLLITNFFKERNIQLLEWASQSPDINPIERIWAHLKQMISKEIRKFQDFEKFKEYVQITFLASKELRSIIQNCIKSIPKNLNKLIEAKGNMID
ncbi:hypothetical protein ABPG72_020133 [Tetrahymena utriculariae]